MPGRGVFGGMAHPPAQRGVMERRADGWPLCPQCGEDELWSPLLWDGTAPPIAAFEAAGLRCYSCGWAKPPSPVSVVH